MTLRSSLADGVLTLTIDREERRNAVTPEVVAALLAAVSAPPSRARVVVLTGAGEKAFCAGADLGAFDAGTTGAFRDLLLALRSCPLPVVARVRGLALAGGLGLMLACDVAVASEDAAFGTPEAGIGLWPFMVSALVARHVSPKRALDLMLTGRPIDAATALAWGFVSRVVPPESLDGEVSSIAAGLARKSPLVLRMGKAAFHETADLALAPALEHLQEQLSVLARSDDAAEGVRAFAEKRQPRWTGS